ncbi:hypothetical protein BJX68DRAFT_252221 [Aspergillus pseudodeflectus]|uniref:Zn(2)-C6 fungal-type domain-containing protein n=1 Tax=Aspergillus pseudodeflectus TaxID=176178 RepID=A0ABR4L3S0_9EURO
MKPYGVNSFRVKLSCSRCRERKLKCDRGEPDCDRCQATNVQCRYPERRKARGARQKTEMDRLGHRLEALEERIRNSQSQSLTPPALDTVSKQGSPRTEPPRVSSEPENTTSTWIYRLVSGAKDNIEDLTNKGQLISDPPSPWAQSTVSNAINRLDTALVRLAAPSARPESSSMDAAKVNLSASEISRYLDTFIDSIACYLTICDSFRTVVDWEFLRAMPHIIHSRYAQVDPAMRIVYYNAIQLAQSMGTESEVRLATRTYYKCLQLVPAWLESAKGSPLDLFAANLTAWAAVNSFDYHLAWQFHREACRFGDMLGVHDVDSPGSGSREENEKENLRQLHWTLVETDFLFRLWYEKPSALKCPPMQVRFPSQISPPAEQPKRARCIIMIVWARAMFILSEFFDTTKGLASEMTDEVENKIDLFCKQIEELLDEWELLSMARSPKTGPMESWIFADSVIAFYSFIIFMRRRACSNDQIAHPQAIKAARTVIQVILEWSDKPLTGAHEGLQGFHTHLVTFYPFCAFFTLYYHILSATDPSEYEEDIASLEAAVSEMKKRASIRPDFVPLVDAMGALNDISRAVHSTRDPLLGVNLTISHSTGQYERPNLPEQGLQPATNEVDFSAAHSFAPFGPLQNLSSDFPLQADNTLDDPFGIPFQLQNQIALNVGPAPGIDLNSTNIDGTQTISQPVDVVRAFENELIWRNWHESWWNSQGTSVAAG